MKAAPAPGAMPALVAMKAAPAPGVMGAAGSLKCVCVKDMLNVDMPQFKSIKYQHPLVTKNHVNAGKGLSLVIHAFHHARRQAKAAGNNGAEASLVARVACAKDKVQWDLLACNAPTKRIAMKTNGPRSIMKKPASLKG
jgi:hypothetical protein